MTYDTGTLVKGLIYFRKPYDVLFRLPREYSLCFSQEVFGEALEVLLGETSLHNAVLELEGITPADVLRKMGQGGVTPLPGPVEIQVCTEPDDDKFLASAISLGCDVLVTEVPDLQKLESNRDWIDFRTANDIPLRILSPDAFAAMIRGQRQATGSGSGRRLVEG